MSVILFDQTTNEAIFQLNFWHWRAIVEAIRSVDVLPTATVDTLHDSFVGELTGDEAHAVAAALRQRLLPTLGDNERLLLDGRRTTEPDDGTLYRGSETDKNYSTNRKVLTEFVHACERCGGFRVA